MNSVQSEKYELSPEEIEKKTLSSGRFRTVFNMHRIDKTNLLHERLDKYDKKKYSAKRRKLRENLSTGEKVLVLAERIKRKPAPGKFYKQSVQKITYFNKEKTFSFIKKQNIDKIDYYWVKNLETNRKISKIFQGTEFLLYVTTLFCKM